MRVHRVRACLLATFVLAVACDAESSDPDATAPSDTVAPADTADTSAPDSDTPCGVCSGDADCSQDVGVCMEAVCDLDACACVTRPVADGAACDDGDLCTSDETCSAGACSGAPACDDGDACTIDSCDPTPGCGDGVSPVDGSCYEAHLFQAAVAWVDAEATCAASGGHLITIDDAAENALAVTLAGGACEGLPAWIGLDVTDGTATWGSGAALDFTAWADGHPGAGSDGGVVITPEAEWMLQTGGVSCFVCELAPAAFSCNATPRDGPPPGDPQELCDGLDNDCDGETDEDTDALCDDGDACTVDVCDGANGCLSEVVEGTCDDDNPCTTDSCDPATGCAHVPDDDACDDGLACTVDRCDAALGCAHETDDAACDDGQACTTEACDAALGCVYTTDDAPCDDGEGCTTDRCEPHEGCVYDTDPTACDDGNPCTADACVASEGCVHTPTEAPCDDGDVCTDGDTCVAGACAGGPPLACDDGVPCTADQCDPALGCVAPFVSECDSPGPVGGVYEGTFQAEGTYPFLGSAFPPVDFTCEAAVSLVADASQTPDVRGVGDARCTFDFGGFGTFQSDFIPGVAEGTIVDLELVGELRAQGVTYDGLVGTIALDDDGVPIGMSGTSTGTMTKDEILTFGGIGGAARAAIQTFGADEAQYTMTFSATRTIVEGTCCGPAPIGCEPSDDYTCYARGWSFAPADAGRCCEDEVCAPRTRAECDVLGHLFVPSGVGACCRDDGCDATPEVLCGLIGGEHASKLACADDNGDGFSDACGPPATYGYDAPPGCALDGDTLTVDVGGVVDVALESDVWTQDGTTFSAGTYVGIPTSLGTINIPGVTSLDVGCGDPFTLVGRVASPPRFEALSAFSSLETTTTASEMAFGYGFGYQLEDLEVPGPYAAARPYFFLHADTGTQIQLGDAVAVNLEEGNRFDLLVDPTDPMVVVAVGGQVLSNATGGLVKHVGVGLSYGGNMTMRSARDLYDGGSWGQFIATGHVYRSGEFALIPIPGLPANLYIEGEVLVDVGPAIDLIEPIATSLIEGDTAAIAAGLAAIGSSDSVTDVLGGLAVAGNANRLLVEVGPVEVTLGNAAWAWRDGRLTFSGEGFTPGAALASGGAGELFEAFSAITLQATGRAWGYVDGSGFRVTTEADLVAGPFELEGARLIIDSDDGVRIEGGSFGFDLAAFLRLLRNLMDCEFSSSGASCSVAGIPIASLSGGLGDAGFHLTGSAGVPVLGQIAFAARIGDDGTFAFKGTAAQGIPGFQTNEVSVVVSEGGFGVSTSWSQFGQAITLSGFIGTDGSYELTGTGATEIVGYELNGASVTLSSETGLTATGHLSLPGFGTLASATLTVPPNIGDWSFHASGNLTVFGHSLGGVTATASSAQGLSLALSGDIGFPAGPNITLSGTVTPSSFSLTVTQALTVAGYKLSSALVTLSNQGLTVAGGIDVLGQRIDVSGKIETNGDFAFHSSLDAGVPLGLFVTLAVRASFVKTGATVTVSGSARGTFFGQSFSSAFSFSSNGQFSWTASVSAGGSLQLRVCTPDELGIGKQCTPGLKLTLEGMAEVKVSNNALGFRFKGRACAGSQCLPEIDERLESSGKVCVSFPVAGRKCISVF